jgi:hypothetical protein
MPQLFVKSASLIAQQFSMDETRLELAAIRKMDA